MADFNATQAEPLSTHVCNYSPLFLHRPLFDNRVSQTATYAHLPSINFYYDITVFAVVKCPTISVPPNVDMSGTGCQEIAPEFGTTCFFNCDQGYKRTEGSHSIVCNANKAWNGSPLQCEGQEDEHVTKQLWLDLHNAWSSTSQFQIKIQKYHPSVHTLLSKYGLNTLTNQNVETYHCRWNLF